MAEEYTPSPDSDWTPEQLLKHAAEIMGSIRMDTPEDQALHGEFVSLFRRMSESFPGWLAAHDADVLARSAEPREGTAELVWEFGWEPRPEDRTVMGSGVREALSTDHAARCAAEFGDGLVYGRQVTTWSALYAADGVSAS